MTNGNGVVSFTKEYPSFEVQGRTFQTRPIDSRAWAETLAEYTQREMAEMKLDEDESERQGAGMLIAVSADGFAALVRLALLDEDREDWDKLNEAGMLDYGTLNALRTWLWEKATERPFSSDTPYSDGPGASAPSSTDESPSPEAVAVA